MRAALHPAREPLAEGSKRARRGESGWQRPGKDKKQRACNSKQAPPVLPPSFLPPSFLPHSPPPAPGRTLDLPTRMQAHAMETDAPTLAEQLNSSDEATQRAAVEGLITIFQQGSRYYVQSRLWAWSAASVAGTGIITPLVRLLYSADDHMQNQAAWLLANLAVWKPNRQAIAAAGAVPRLIHLLRTAAEEARRGAAVVIANICDECPSNQEAVATAGAIPPLVSLLEATTSDARHAAAVALAAVSCRSPSNQRAVAAAGAIRPLIRLLDDSEEPMLVAAARALACVRRENCSCQEAAAAAGGIPALVRVLDVASELAQEAATVALTTTSATAFPARRPSWRLAPSRPWFACWMPGPRACRTQQQKF